MKKNKNAISIAFLLLAVFISISAYNRIAIAQQHPMDHSQASWDNVSPIYTDQDMTSVEPGSTDTIKVFIEALTGNIYSSGTIFTSESVTTSNVFATDVIVHDSVYASGSLYASDGVWVPFDGKIGHDDATRTLYWTVTSAAPTFLDWTGSYIRQTGSTFGVYDGGDTDGDDVYLRPNLTDGATHYIWLDGGGDTAFRVQTGDSITFQESGSFYFADFNQSGVALTLDSTIPDGLLVDASGETTGSIVSASGTTSLTTGCVYQGVIDDDRIFCVDEDGDVYASGTITPSALSLGQGDYFYWDDPTDTIRMTFDGTTFIMEDSGGSLSASIDGNFNASGGITAVNGTFTTNLNVDNDLQVDGDVQVDGDLNSDSDITVNGGAGGAGGVSMSSVGDVETSANINAGTYLETGTYAEIGSYITVATYADIEGVINASSTIALDDGNYIVWGGDETFGYDATSSAFLFTDDVEITDDLTVSATGTFGSASVTTDVWIGDDLTVVDTITAGSMVIATLSFTNASGTSLSLTNDLEVNDVLASGFASATNLYISNEEVIDANHDLFVDNGTFDDDVTIGGTLGVTGLITATGGIEIGDGGTYVLDSSGDLVARYATATTLEVGGGYGDTGITMNSDGSLLMNGKLTVDGVIDPTSIILSGNIATPIVDITQAGAGYDVDGTASTWYVEKDGEATFASAIITNAITATTYYGDGSNLTGIAGSTSNLGQVLRSGNTATESMEIAVASGTFVSYSTDTDVGIYSENGSGVKSGYAIKGVSTGLNSYAGVFESTNPGARRSAVSITTNSTGAAVPALNVTNTSYGRAIDAQCDAGDGSNSGSCMYLRNTTREDSLLIEYAPANAARAGNAIDARASGAGAAVNGYNNGTGEAGLFQTNAAGNADPALAAKILNASTNADAFYIDHDGAAGDLIYATVGTTDVFTVGRDGNVHASGTTVVAEWSTFENIAASGTLLFDDTDEKRRVVPLSGSDSPANAPANVTTCGVLSKNYAVGDSIYYSMTNPEDYASGPMEVHVTFVQTDADATSKEYRYEINYWCFDYEDDLDTDAATGTLQMVDTVQPNALCDTDVYEFEIPEADAIDKEYCHIQLERIALVGGTDADIDVIHLDQHYIGYKVAQ